MAGTSLPLLQQRSFGETSRRDTWWLQPALILGGLSAFIVYSTWSAFQGAHYWVPGTNYLSPFYSPELFGNSPHAWFGTLPSWWPDFLPYSPAFLILWAPAGFRFTCYYYRGAYYKAFWADPPACAVGEPRKSYIGEQGWPLRIQNIHRYFMYVAVVFIFMLAIDAIKAFWFADGFGIGVGTLILCVNVVLLSGYTFGCHSLRHIVGGRKDCISESPLCHKMYKGCSSLNKKHMLWAWMSLCSVMFSDVYVRLCSMGIWHDIRII
ncbi:MAG: succinate dehydrogenase [Planctomycetes bacterium]|nr:succinate dehydrogenase [Planctomycetota bacterium]